MAFCPDERHAAPFEKVLRDELEQIRESRKVRGVSQPVPRCGSAKESAAASELFGLSFSGGGIRSATFNLGVLQGLAQHKLLPHIDYLSTVSGGGYIGAWFLSLLKEDGS